LLHFSDSTQLRTLPSPKMVLSCSIHLLLHAWEVGAFKRSSNISNDVGTFGMLGFTTKKTKVRRSAVFSKVILVDIIPLSLLITLLVLFLLFLVPQLPYLAGSYKHVGMEIRLRRKKPPVFDYPTHHSWKQTGQNLWDSITSLPEALKYHSCSEMLKRIGHAEPAMRATTLQDEYQRMWGIMF
jgi:hypothetical protein